MAVSGTRRHSAPSVCVCACSRARGEGARVSSPMKYECRSASGMPQALGAWSSSPLSLSRQRAWAVRTAAAARGTHCNSEALTVNEWRVARGGTDHIWSGQSHWRHWRHSESICGHPWPSVAQGMSSDANRCTQMQLHSGASSCTQLRTAANSCNQSHSPWQPECGHPPQALPRE